MSNREKYISAFTATFLVEEAVVVNLRYQGIAAWDSVGHMSLIAALEDVFKIEMDIDDIIDLSSFEAGRVILKKYSINIE